MSSDPFPFKRVLVTGGAGFIGSHLCEQLALMGCDVVSLDDYSNGFESNHISGVRYIRGHTVDIEQHITGQVDAVFHLGEYARTSQSFFDLDRVWKSNMDGTFRVLEFCRKRGIKIIYAGSSTKFADGHSGFNQSPYAWTKAHNTGLVTRYGAWFSLPHAITYFYNVYGERESSDPTYGSVVAIFLESKKSGQPLKVVRPGSQKRIFTYVKDIVGGLIKAAESGSGDGYALGSCDEYSIEDLARMIGGTIEYVEPRQGDRSDAVIDLSKTEKELNWKAKHNLKDYIESQLHG